MKDTDIIIAIIITTLVILILISVIIISIFVASRQRVRQEVILANTRLNYEQELRQVEMEVSEQMMETFSRELHDNIGHILTCIRIQIENKKLDNPALEYHFAPIEVHLTDAATQLRLLSRSLNTDYISNVGLNAAIALEVERLQQLKRINVSYTSQVTLNSADRNRELMLFRIFQEIVQNALRHSNAKNLLINLAENEGFYLEIKDDGRGFDLVSIFNSDSASGLKNILKRAKMAGIHCDINTEPGKGCSYILKS